MTHQKYTGMLVDTLMLKTCNNTSAVTMITFNSHYMTNPVATCRCHKNHHEVEVVVEVTEMVEAVEMAEVMSEVVETAEVDTHHHQDSFLCLQPHLQHYTSQTNLSAICHHHLWEIRPKWRIF
jgi:hypothetical protein